MSFRDRRKLEVWVFLFAMTCYLAQPARLTASIALLTLILRWADTGQHDIRAARRRAQLHARSPYTRGWTP